MQTVSQLQDIAKHLRYDALDAIVCGGSGHPGGSLSIADIMAVLYFDVMNVDPKDPKADSRDRFVLSKGHASPILYATLAKKGLFPQETLKTLRHVDSFLQGHPDMKHTPGVDMSTGSLGQGISAACGMAKGAKLQGKNYRVYTILGDGEIDEGEAWEAFMFAAHNKLDNLTIVVDHNGLQIDGSNDEVMSLKDIALKLKAFGLNVIEIDGHDFEQIQKAFESAKQTHDIPTVILANTIKGKGVSFMENQVGWHGKAPSAEDLQKAKLELGV